MPGFVREGPRPGAPGPPRASGPVTPARRWAGLAAPAPRRRRGVSRARTLRPPDCPNAKPKIPSHLARVMGAGACRGARRSAGIGGRRGSKPAVARGSRPMPAAPGRSQRRTDHDPPFGAALQGAAALHRRATWRARGLRLLTVPTRRDSCQAGAAASAPPGPRENGVLPPQDLTGVGSLSPAICGALRSRRALGDLSSPLPGDASLVILSLQLIGGSAVGAGPCGPINAGRSVVGGVYRTLEEQLAPLYGRQWRRTTGSFPDT